jgi:hypothetical protein
MKVCMICRLLGISEQSFCGQRHEYGRLKVSQVKPLKELEKERQRLLSAVAGLTLDARILKPVFYGECRAPPGVGWPSVTCTRRPGRRSAASAGLLAGTARLRENQQGRTWMRKRSIAAMIRLLPKYRG